MAEAGSSRRVKCDYKRLWALKGLERLQHLLPQSSKVDEVKVLFDAMFCVNQLENKVAELRKAVKKMKNKSPEMYSSDKEMEQGENNVADLPEDLKDLDEIELRQLHNTPFDIKQEIMQLDEDQ